MTRQGYLAPQGYSINPPNEGTSGRKDSGGISAKEFVLAFKRNCPTVALSRAHEEELARLFAIAMGIPAGLVSP